MVSIRRTFPFSAIRGQHRMKLALVLNAVDPGIGGVLIRGQKGTAKSTAVRALAALLPEQQVVVGCHYGCDPAAGTDLCDDCLGRQRAGEQLVVGARPMRVVDLPINSSEDRVVGSIDLEAALKHGRKRFEPGVLADANRNILYVDEVNLLDDHIVDVLLDAAASGINYVEREGVSVAHPSRFILVGTMNPEEGELRPQLLDRFGLCVDVEGIQDVEERVMVVEEAQRFAAADPGFEAEYEAADRRLAEELAAAIRRLPSVRVSPAQIRLMSQICVQAGVRGHRADVIMERTARALAAIRGHASPSREDVFDAAELVLTHRATTRGSRAEPGGGEATASGDAGDPQPEGSEQATQQAPAASDQTGEVEDSDTGGAQQAPEGSGATDQGAVPGSTGAADSMVEAEDTFDVRKLDLARQRQQRRQTGKRISSISRDKRGRYVRSETRQKVNDLAVDATIRAAAPEQPRRGRRTGDPLKLERHDLRQKVRERKVGNLIVFVVDASASMDAEQRMAATKGAILSLLEDAYVRRDKVAVVVFKNRSAEIVLQPTSSTSMAQRRLEKMSVGGTTPLTHGLMTGYKVIKGELLRDSTIRPLLVLISDGRGNISMFKEEPLVEAQQVAALIQAEGIEAMVIDSARDYSDSPNNPGLGRVSPMYQTYAVNACSDLAERMGARYYGLYDLSREEISRAINTQLRR